MPADAIVVGLAIAVAAYYIFINPWVHRRLFGLRKSRELEDPFAAEVLYSGEVVADLSDRVLSDMYWRNYRIDPRSDKARAIISNDALWEECAFTFRDPKTGRVCSDGFVGEAKPFVKDGRISLRALYFDRSDHPAISEHGGGRRS